MDNLPTTHMYNRSSVIWVQRLHCIIGITTSRVETIITVIIRLLDILEAYVSEFFLKTIIYKFKNMPTWSSWTMRLSNHKKQRYFNWNDYIDLIQIIFGPF